MALIALLDIHVIEREDDQLGHRGHPERLVKLHVEVNEEELSVRFLAVFGYHVD